MLRPARSIPITCAPWGTGDGGDERSSTPVPPPYQWPLGGRGLCMHQCGDRNRSDARGGGEGTVLSVTLMWPDPVCEDRAEVSSEREEPGSKGAQRNAKRLAVLSVMLRCCFRMITDSHCVGLGAPDGQDVGDGAPDMDMTCRFIVLYRSCTDACRQARWRRGQWE